MQSEKHQDKSSYQKPRIETQKMLAQTALACSKGPGDGAEEADACFPNKGFTHDKTS